MNELDMQRISQFIDGEMADQDAREFRQRLLAEPELRAQYEQLKAVNTRVGEAFSGAELEEVPASVVHALTGAERAAGSRVAMFSWPRGAIAASLVAACAVMLVPDWGQHNMAPEQGGFASTLDTVLESAASRAQGWEALADGSQVRPLLSFRSQEGAWCREFLVATDSQAQRGVACRGETGWHARLLVSEVLPGAATDYRPANSHDVDEIAAYVSQHAEGEVLSLAEESDIISRNWQ